MIGWLVNRPNTIREKQIYYQNAPGLTYQKGPRQKLYMAAFMLLFVPTTGLSYYTLIQFVRGKAKKVGE